MTLPVRRTLSISILLAMLLVDPAIPTVGGDEQGRPFDATRLEGKTLRPVKRDDVLLLGVVSRGILNRAKKGDKLTAEQLRLVVPTAQAYQAKKYDDAYRLVSRFLLAGQGVELGEASELATSLDFRLDRKLIAPGDPLTVLIEPLFSLPHEPKQPYTVQLTLLTVKGETVADTVRREMKELHTMQHPLQTGNLEPGRYTVGYQLVGPDGKTLAECSRDFVVHRDIKPRLQTLQKQVAHLKEIKASERGAQQKAAVETVGFVAEILDRATREYVAPMLKNCSPMTAKLRGLSLRGYDSDLFDIERDLATASELAEDLLAGKNSLSTRTGNLRLAYLSSVDQTYQPYRVYVPKDYKPGREYPLIVALHGATGDENTYMDRYLQRGSTTPLFSNLAEERGYLLVTPNGRGAFGMYLDNSEKDVLDVLERVKAIYTINPRQVFLTGHSMGGSGTWMLGFKHRELFAALAPVAGQPPLTQTIPFTNAPDKPVLFFAGTRDTLVPPEATRVLSERAKKELKNFDYVEKDDDHFYIGVTTMPAVFDFFDGQRRKK